VYAITDRGHEVLVANPDDRPEPPHIGVRRGDVCQIPRPTVPRRTAAE
jgi:hypothetical protein